MPAFLLTTVLTLAVAGWLVIGGREEDKNTRSWARRSVGETAGDA